jgi:hypothetical protein
MNLVKWLRKNNMKVMAVVVIVLMVAFVGGSALNYLLSPRMTLGYKAVAYYGNNRKIKSSDLSLARMELEILKLLGADDLLRAQDLRGVLLAELLFSESRPSTALINQMKQVIRSNRYRISDRQIDNIYKHTMQNYIYWLLLRDEAQLAGIKVTNNEVGQLLAKVIPQLFRGQTYKQRIRMLMEQYGIPEAGVLETVGKLLAVLQYGNLICSNEDVTISQVMHLASCENETVDVEFVKFDSAVFAETQEQPSEEKMLEHFQRYKDTYAGDVSEENPYGFGYKLPDMVQLEYIAVKLDDISPIVTPPTPQETEDYYRKHISQFTESVPQDPNDPNSQLVEKARSYAEVASIISKQLLRDKINSKAESILQEVRTLTETNLQDIEPENLSEEQLKLRGADYETVTKKVAEKYKVKIYTGQTGLLSAADVDADEYLRRLYMTGQGRNPVRLRQIIFSIPDLTPDQVGGDEQQSGSAADKRSSLDLISGGQRPNLFENIGPVRDLLAEIMLLVRVTKAEKTSTPESIDQTFSKQTLDFRQEQASESTTEGQHIYSVKQKVANDLKKLAVINDGLVKSKAEEFIELAAKDGWDKSLHKFNELYKQTSSSSVESQSKQDENDPNVFKVEQLANLRRIPKATLATLETQSQGSRGEQLFVQEAQKWLSVDAAKIQSRFIDQLYSLVPQNSSTAKSLPLLMEFKPEMSFYVIKNILIKRLGLEEYEKNRAKKFFKEDHIQSESMAVVHFNPENILKRMNFRPAKQRSETKAESEDAS